MTPIQAAALPPILEGKDVIAQAQTGSGKTAAFGLGLLNKLDVSSYAVQTLVLCPTRELADQVAKELRKLARGIPNIKILSLCGGSPFRFQAESLTHGSHIIVGTPGRVEDHLKRETLHLRKLTTLVLDEADRMLDMGFADTLDNIVSYTPPGRQTLLFSATFPEKIETTSHRIMRSPQMIEIDNQHDDSSIAQTLYCVGNEAERLDALIRLLITHKPNSAVVFCNLKKETTEVAAALNAKGFDAMALNGDLEQRERDETLALFVNQSISILVATDVAARGLDIDNLDAVFNYQIANDLEVHTHRIGRTGRAGAKGQAFTLVSDRESGRLARLEEYLEQSIQPTDLPADSVLSDPPYTAPMATLLIQGGRRDKLRPGDILGALTHADGINGKDVGKIQIYDLRAYVAVTRSAANDAYRVLDRGKLKGRKFRVQRI